MTRTRIDARLDDDLVDALREGDAELLAGWLRAGGDARALHGSKSLISQALSAPEDKVAALVTLLVAAGADPEDGGQLPLRPIHQAAMASAGALRAIIGAGADVEAAMPNGARALHLCVGRGGEARLAVLLEAGADPDAPDGRGRTPLHAAAHAMAADALDLLLKAGADPNAADLDGATPFHAALLSTWWSSTREAGAGHDAAGRVRRDDLRGCLRRLAEAGCDLARTDKDGRSALDMLKESFSAMEVLEILQT